MLLRIYSETRRSSKQLLTLAEKENVSKNGTVVVAMAGTGKNATMQKKDTKAAAKNVLTDKTSIKSANDDGAADDNTASAAYQADTGAADDDKAAAAADNAAANNAAGNDEGDATEQKEVAVVGDNNDIDDDDDDDMSTSDMASAPANSSEYLWERNTDWEERSPSFSSSAALAPPQFCCNTRCIKPLVVNLLALNLLCYIFSLFEFI